MKLSELIRFAEEQAKKERNTPSQPLAESDSGASWADTLGLLKIMEERGVPKSLQDDK